MTNIYIYILYICMSTYIRKYNQINIPKENVLHLIKICFKFINNFYIDSKRVLNISISKIEI